MTLDQGLFVVHLRPITASIRGICSNYTLLSPPVNQPSSKFRTIIANSVDSPAIRNIIKVFSNAISATILLSAVQRTSSLFL